MGTFDSRFQSSFQSTERPHNKSTSNISSSPTSNSSSSSPSSDVEVDDVKWKKAAMEMKQLRDNAVALDAGLRFYLDTWEAICNRESRPDLYRAALKALSRPSLGNLYESYNRSRDQQGFKLQPPQRRSQSRVKYDKPSRDFIAMGMSLLHVLGGWVHSCDILGNPITRLHWIYILMDGIHYYNTLKADPELRIRAALFCLVISAATTDMGCIRATIRMYRRGLLDLQNLAKASLSDIEECIGIAGIQKIRARYLRDIARILLKEYGGRVPCDLLVLKDLPGVGRKAALILLNEIFGMHVGIGTDSHVCAVAHGLGLFQLPSCCKNPTPNNVEYSLRTWVPQNRFKEVNPIMGGAAQLIVQEIGHVSSADQLTELRVALEAMFQYHGSCYQVELLWYCIKSIRAYYAGRHQLEADDEFRDSVPVEDRREPAVHQLEPSDWMGPKAVI